MKILNKFIEKGNNCCIGYKNGIKSWLTWSDATKIRKGGRKMTIEEKVDIVSKIFAALEVVPQNQKDQLAGIIIGYSMANQMKEAKGG